MTKHILVIEDARDMQLMLRAILEDTYTLTFAESLDEAERFVKTGNYDLILLDVILPDGSGFGLCEKLKSSGDLKNVPVIFLTGETDVDQRVKGLQLGADDYVLKPFDEAELRARVQSQLRRAESQFQGQTAFKAGKFKIDTAIQKAIVSTPGQPERDLDLTRIEFKLLVHFLKNPGRVFSRADLLKQVWGADTHVSEHTVDTHISSLRKKIGISGGEIKAIVRQGYLFASA